MDKEAIEAMGRLLLNNQGTLINNAMMHKRDDSTWIISFEDFYLTLDTKTQTFSVYFAGCA